jgi:uncharacterized protein (DUF427 family)
MMVPSGRAERTRPTLSAMGAPEFDIDLPPWRLEPTPRWVRVRRGDHWIADSTEALLLVWYGSHRLPTYCLPPDAVRTDLLHPSAAGAGSPAEFMTPHDVMVDGSTIERAAFLLSEPPAPFEAADGYWTFAWDDPSIEWYEEAIKVHVHARDPQHRVDAIPSERHVHVELDGELLAESSQPTAVFETTLPTRWYLPPEEVRMDLLEPSDTVTQCPFKGVARFYSARVGGVLHRDVAWSYPDPIRENPRIAELIAFFNERVDLIIDGERERRPFTPWSLDVRA